METTSGRGKQARFTRRIQRVGQPVLVTRPKNIGGMDRVLNLMAIVEPLSVMSASTLELEGWLNVGEPVPYLLTFPGDTDVREGDLCYFNNLTWEFVQVTNPLWAGVSLVCYALMTRLSANVLAPGP